MKKVIATAASCRECPYLVSFTSEDRRFSILVCGKTTRILTTVRKTEIRDCDIPDDCPLPDFVEPKTD